MKAGSTSWAALSEIARVAGLSNRAVELAAARARAGKTWRGCDLIVRATSGRGGAAGLRWEVRSDSLPVELRRRLLESTALVSAETPALPAPIEKQRSLPAPREAARTTAIAERRLEIIRPALAHPPGSTERREAVRIIAALAVKRPGGRTVKKLAPSTIYEWIRAYEARQLAGLAPSLRSSERRVLVSRRWDEAVPFPEDARAGVSEKLHLYVRAMHAKGESRQTIIDCATMQLVELTRAAGFEHPELETICKVPRAFVDERRNDRLLDDWRHDARRFADRAVPRTRRTREGLEPLSIVCADVHPIDVYYRRADGRLATPKLIAFMDLKTNRLFGEVVFLEKGEGIRQEHVALAFARMVESWGMPKLLMIDNGGEFARLGVAEAAMRLAARRDDFGFGYFDDPLSADLVESRRSQFIKSKPYNAPAKPIEGIFSVLERTVLRAIRGHVGGNRIVKKTANLGRPPTPYPGSVEALRAEFLDAIENYNGRPQQGQLAGASPNGAWNQPGWKASTCDADVLLEAFAIDVPCQVWQCEVKVRGVRFAARELGTILPRTKLIARMVPGRREALILDKRGKPLCVAQPVKTYPMLDREGAKEQSRRAAQQQKDLRRMWAELPPVEPIEELNKVNAMRPKARQPESAGRISLNAQHEALAAARKALPANADARPVDRARQLWAEFKPRPTGSDS